MVSDDDQRWLQGSVLDQPHVRLLLEADALPDAWSVDDLVVVLTHSCDIAARDPQSEPVIEVIRGVSVDTPDGNLTHGKSPRDLHITLADGAHVSFNIHDRHRVVRDEILESNPGEQLDEPNRRLMARWAGKRYWREAFPDAFNNRIAEVSSALRRLVKGSAGAQVTGLYVILEQDFELPDDEAYGFDLVAAVRALDYQDPERRGEVQQMFDKFAGLLAGVDGVALGECLLRSEADISLDDLRYLRRWDYDDLSMRVEPPPISPEASA